MNCIQKGIILSCVFAILVNGQRLRNRVHPRRRPQGGAAGTGMDMHGAAGAAPGMDPIGAAGGPGAAAMLNPMGIGRPFVLGMTAQLVTDLMNGHPGPVPMDIAQEAAAMRAMGMTPDQISDTLGDKMQVRQGFARMGAAAAAQNMLVSAAFGGAAVGGAGGPHYSGADAGAQAHSGAPVDAAGAGPGFDLFGTGAASVGAGVAGHGAPGISSGAGVDMYSPAGAGAGIDPFGAAGAPGVGGAAGLNPMGVGRPIVPGMTAGLVMDLMNGQPGPVPMDIAQEALAMRAMGMTPDQISDTLGDKMQVRQGFARIGAAAAALG
ncbi:uncharacterized PE-PGRS family protein PE_PGRS54-like [Dreissena polymorpha]|uniref:Uncharacterized protein n=1 Tax=Dreissena polymorpha TaxID=45954 RepID=A0A9D4MFQ3_DREPO|nr:uncharacterized PE-PGRS family protein PE_PGRS54-like [Dreissena polymorpha]KAH3875708.1 hypothetical protein DPMN_038984 [Dreissena polymorpha]